MLSGEEMLSGGEKRSLDDNGGLAGSPAKVMPHGGRFGMKFLFTTAEMDVISRNGAGVAEIHAETGATLVTNRLPYPGTELEELSITGASSDVVIAALLQAQSRLMRELGSISNGEFDVPPSDGRLKAVVPTRAAAGLIGRGGENIKYMRAQTGIHVHIDSHSIPPTGGDLAEQVVAFSGSLSGLQVALPILCEHVETVVAEPWFATWASTSNTGLEIPGLWLELSGKGIHSKGSGKGPPSGKGALFGPTFGSTGEICSFFARTGQCKFGDGCRLSHNLSANVSTPSASLGGPPTGEICQFFMKAGWCKYGEACRHIHPSGVAPAVVAPPGLPPQLPASNSLGPGSGEICQFFAKAGWCKYGDACRFGHTGQQAPVQPPAVAGEVCQFFAKAGWCKFGQQCRLIHSGFGAVQISGPRQGEHGPVAVPPPLSVRPPAIQSGEPCLFFAKSGWCKFGEACKHSHSVDDVAFARALGGEQPNGGLTAGTGEFCEFFAKAGWCKFGDTCKYMHHTGVDSGPMSTSPLPDRPIAPPQSSGEACQFFTKTGWCKYGDACRHFHDPASVAASELARPPPASTGELCQFFVKSGWCKFGDACKHSHEGGPVVIPPPSLQTLPPLSAPPRSSSEACKFFAQNGWCKYGDACRHHHIGAPGTLGAQYGAPGAPSESGPFNGYV